MVKIYDLKNYLDKDEKGNIICTIKPEHYYLIMSLENLPGEIWRTIKGYSLYEVSNMGRVKAKAYEKWESGETRKQLAFRESHIMAQGICYGYLVVSLIGDDGKRRTIRVNRLVLQTFCENPDNLTDACHINEIRFDNRLSNLKWGSHKENTNHSLYKQRLSKKNGTHIKCDGHEFTSIKKAAGFYGITLSLMWKWLRGVKPMPQEWKDRGLQLLEE